MKTKEILVRHVIDSSYDGQSVTSEERCEVEIDWGETPPADVGSYAFSGTWHVTRKSKPASGKPIVDPF